MPESCWPRTLSPFGGLVFSGTQGEQQQRAAEADHRGADQHAMPVDDVEERLRRQGRGERAERADAHHHAVAPEYVSPARASKAWLASVA